MALVRLVKVPTLLIKAFLSALLSFSTLLTIVKSSVIIITVFVTLSLINTTLAWDCWPCPCDFELLDSTCCCGDRICCEEDPRDMDSLMDLTSGEAPPRMTDNVVVIVFLSLLAVGIIPCIIMCYKMLRYRARMKRGMVAGAKTPGSAFQLASESGIAQGTPGVYRPSMDDAVEQSGLSSTNLAEAEAKISHTSLHNPSVLQWKVK